MTSLQTTEAEERLWAMATYELSNQFDEVDRAAAQWAISEIEWLRSAIKDFQSYGCPVCNGDCAAANPPVMACPMKALSNVR